MRDRAVAVHGLGYVGLTAAVHFAKAGFRVVGYDPDARVVEALNAGHPKAEEFLGYMKVDVEFLVGANLLEATTNFELVSRMHEHILAVPSERDDKPYMDIVLGALDRLWRAAVDQGDTKLACVESTLTPGTIDQWLAEHKEDNRALSIAVCPRRDWFADPSKNLATLSRVVGGVTVDETLWAVELLSNVSDSILMTNYRTAEITKALENALLHTQIALVNELTEVLPDADVAEAAALATTHWRLTPIYPSGGAGGRCVPLGTEYLHRASRYKSRMLSQVLDSEEWHRRVIANLAWRLAGGGEVAILGVAYRPNFKDAGSSPGLSIARLIGAQASVHDPMFNLDELTALVEGPASNRAGVEASVYSPEHVAVTVLVTPHDEYATIPERVTFPSGHVVIDCQGAWAKYAWMLKNQGVDYRRVGEPGWQR